MDNKITADDVEEIYNKIEGTKKGNFYIDSTNKKKSEITPNHVEKTIADFYSSGSKDGFEQPLLKEDGQVARKMTLGLING